MKRVKKPIGQPVTRSAVGLAAHQQTGGGTHGGGKRRRNRKDRQAARRALRGGGLAMLASLALCAPALADASRSHGRYVGWAKPSERHAVHPRWHRPLALDFDGYCIGTIGPGDTITLVCHDWRRSVTKSHLTS